MNLAHAARPYAALLVLAGLFAGLFALLAPPASAMVVDDPGFHGRYAYANGAPDASNLGWAAHVVGPGTDLTPEAADRLALLREDGCDALHSHVPAAAIVDGFADALGNRRDAVSLFTATAVWCDYAG